jgi:hypothetical protein
MLKKVLIRGNKPATRVLYAGHPIRACKSILLNAVQTKPIMPLYDAKYRKSSGELLLDARVRGLH